MEVSRELVVPAAPEEVWDALTSEERLAEWFANEVELDATAGGGAVFRWANGEARRAVVEEIEDGRLLRLRWWDEEAPAEVTVVAIAVTPVEHGTRVVVTESAASGFAWALQLHFSAVPAAA